MKIKKLIIINWGNIPNQEYTFLDGLNLLVGDTGSGKSTILDAIQTVLTAAKRGLVDYNAGQGTEETRSSNKVYRTYQSYILGGDEGRKFSRTEAKGVIACVFEDSKANVFSAWVFGDAYLEINGKKRAPKLHEDPKLGIVNNAEISIDDFLHQTSSGKQVKDFSAIKHHVKDTYGNTNAEVFETKKYYLGRLYGLFRGSNKSVTENDINKMAKAFTSYIYPKEVPDAHRFVFNELLEKRDIKSVIENLSDILQRSNRLKDEAKRYENANNSLNDILNDGAKSITMWKKVYSNRYMHALKGLHTIEKTMIAQLETIRTLEIKAKYEKEMADNGNHVYEELEESIRVINKNIDNNDAVIQKKELEKKLEESTKEQEKNLNNIRNFFIGLEQILSTLKLGSSYDTTGYVETLILELEIFVVENKHKTLDTDTACKNFIDNVNRYSSILKNIVSLEDETSLFSKIDTTYHELTIESKTIKEQVDLLEEESLKLESGGRVSYPPYIEKAINLLQTNRPEANARILCEMINFKDTSWQSAIEGYLKGNRYAVIVEPTWVASATKLLKDNNLYGVKILQSERLLHDIKVKGEAVAFKSIINLLSFSDPIAKAYMILNYGGVVQVDDAKTLSNTSRGLTIDGMGSSGYANYYCGLKLHECVIGQHVKQEHLSHLKSEILIYKNNKQKIDIEISLLKGPRARFANIEKNLIDEKNLFTVSALPNLYKKKEELQNEISMIDLGEVQSLVTKCTKLESDKKELSAKITQYTKDESAYSTQRKAIFESYTNEEKNFNRQIEKVNNEKKYFSELLYIMQESVESILSEVEKSAKTNDLKDIITDFSDIQKYSIEMLYKTKSHNTNEIPISYVKFEDFEIEDSVDCFSLIINLIKTAEHVHENIKNNLLFEKKEDIEENNKEFMTVFIDSFCTNIYKQILDGKNQISTIDRVLKRHRFDDAYYTITTELNTAYKEYYELFRKVYEQPTTKNLLTQEFDVQEKYDVVHRIYEMLLDTDEKSEIHRELTNLSDYRNYYKYDIKMIISNDVENATSLNEMATSSGGQSETSYYVIRSIAAYSAFGLDVKKKDVQALQFLCIDEGFGKVDEFRPEKILDYLVKDLGFQLITAMPTSRQAIFIDYASTRHLVMKEVVDSSLNSYKVNVEVEYDVFNTPAIKELKNRDMKQIEMEFDNA